MVVVVLFLSEGDFLHTVYTGGIVVYGLKKSFVTFFSSSYFSIKMCQLCFLGVGVSAKEMQRHI